MNAWNARSPMMTRLNGQKRRRPVVLLLVLFAAGLIWSRQSSIRETPPFQDASPPVAPPIVRIHQELDAQAIRKARRVQLPGGAFYLQIPGGALDRPGTVSLSGCAPEEIPSLPPDKRLISSVYQYAIEPGGRSRAFLQPGLVLQDSTRPGSIYVYEPDRAAWSRLSGTQKVGDHIAGKTRRTRGLVAAFAERLPGGEVLKRQIGAPAFLVVDAATGNVLLERNSRVPRAVASLTKLMTASVFLDHLPARWDSVVTIVPEDRVRGSRLYLRTGDRMSARDLFHAALMRSANDATMALVHATGLSVDDFVDKMNQKARSLGMVQTRFAEPTGLSAQNRSTAEDYVKLGCYMMENPLFRQVTTMPDYTVTTMRGSRNRTLLIRNTNRMLQKAPIVFSKTGFTLEAGRCLLVGARGETGCEVVAVVMGARAAGSQYRDMRLLLNAALGELGRASGPRF